MTLVAGLLAAVPYASGVRGSPWARRQEAMPPWLVVSLMALVLLVVHGGARSAGEPLLAAPPLPAGGGH
jgi:hypothetical protein